MTPAVLTPDDVARFDDLTDGELLRLRGEIRGARTRTAAERKRNASLVARIDLYRARRRR